MTRRRVANAAAATALAATLLFVATPPAAADVVNPPGACFGQGTWQGSGQVETTAEHQPSDVIDIPAADTVLWEGRIGNATVGEEGPERTISGSVKAEFWLGSITIDTWGNDSVVYANAGEHEYDAPPFMHGIKILLSGSHSEDGAVFCSGQVYVQIGDPSIGNPIAIAGIVLMGGGVVLLFFAGKPLARKLWSVH